MSKGRFLALSAVIVLGLLAFQNCEMAQPNRLQQRDFASMTPTPTPTPGPDDVRYILGGWICGGIDLLGPAQTVFGIRSIQMDVTPSLVRQMTLYFSSSCARTQTFYHSYPSSGMMTLLHGPTECSLCSSAQCFPMGTPNPPINTSYTRTQTTSSLTLSRVLSSIETSDPGSVYKQAICQPGQLEVLTFLRQF